MQQMPMDKLSFNPGARKLAQIGGGMDTDKRNAESLEYIAHYLEKIEGHLSIIAAQSSNSGKIEMAVNNGLKGVGTAILAAAGKSPI